MIIRISDGHMGAVEEYQKRGEMKERQMHPECRKKAQEITEGYLPCFSRTHHTLSLKVALLAKVWTGIEEKLIALYQAIEHPTTEYRNTS